MWRGQKTWNGVAILARKAEPVLIRTALPGDRDDHEARYIEAAVNGIVVTSIYLPNGNPQPGPKFDYKLDWFTQAPTARREIHQAGHPGRAGRRLQCRADAARYLSDQVVGQGCADPAEEPRRVQAAGGAGLDRCDPRAASGKADVHASGAHTAPAAPAAREAREVPKERPAQASAAPATEPAAEPGPQPAPQAGPDLELDQVVDAWQRSIVEAVRERSIPVASLLAEATPTELADDTLTLEFPAGADFHRRQVGEPGNIGVLHDALFEVTGRRITVVLETGDAVAAEDQEDEPISEDDWISSLKDTFDAREVEPDQ